MNNTAMDFLFKVEPPWIYVGLGEPERKAWNPTHFYSRPDLSVCVRRVRGQKMRSIPALMSEFGAAFQLFDGFGENWYALEECLGYLDEWMPASAYILLIDRAEELLADEPASELTSFLRVLQAVGDNWSKPIRGGDRFDRSEIPFHALVTVSTPSASARRRIVDAARVASVQVRA